MASSSWCKETDEKINYTKLCRLLVDGGTQAVRAVFDGIHPPSSLTAVLNANKTKLQKRKKPRGKVLNNEQWDKLYPPSGSNPKSEDFDITLLFVLLRNICGLTPPATGWDVLPPITDTSLEANLARIKYYRNNTKAHKPDTEINDADFEQYWQDISSALVSLGLSQEDIDDLKSARLGEKEYNQLLYDWYISDEDIKTQLEDLKSKTRDIKSDTGDLKSDTADLKSDTADLKSDTADIKKKLDDMSSKRTYGSKHDNPIHKLAQSDFKREIAIQCQSFHPNTRQWILDQVKSHVDSDQPESCVMLITAGPGMGKSTIAAKICQTYKDLGCLGGCHFFQFSNSTRNNPRLMLQSIARQMCDTVAGYGEALERKLQTNLGKQITEMNCEELLTILLEEPLCQLQQTESNFVVVLDALDECSYDSKDEFMKALRTKLPCLPSWLRFVITTRPSGNTSLLDSTIAVEMLPEDQSNLVDLKCFLCFELTSLYPQYGNDVSEDLLQKLVQITKGLFLVAFFVVDVLKRKSASSPDEVLKLFPNGISSVYENYFSRLKEVLLPYISEEERFYKMLEAVGATKNPLPVNMFYKILGLKGEREVNRQEKKTRKDALNSLHWLFPVEIDHVTVFHKSVVDWLILEGEKEHDFSVRVEDGNEVLANQCYDVLSDIRNGEKDVDKLLDVTDSEKYALVYVWDLIKTTCDSSLDKSEKIDKFLNFYILAAIIPTVIPNQHFGIKCFRKISEIMREIIVTGTTTLYVLYYFTQPLFPLVCPPLFGSCLAFVLQSALVNGLDERLEPNPLDCLSKYRLPYCDVETLGTIQSTTSESCTIIHEKVLIAADYPIESFPSKLVVLKHQLDVNKTDSKCFVGKRKITASPNISFIVVSEEKGNKIEILDVTTLEVVSQYESPHHQIESCHVFGDDCCWFIVIKGCHDNKMYVIEGLTGQVRYTISVSEDSEVKDVSRQGHILVTRPWKPQEPEETKITNNDGEVGTERVVEFSLSSKLGLQTPSKHRTTHSYREMFLEYLPTHLPAQKMLQCHESFIFGEFWENKAVQFSEDGGLFAYHNNDCIYIAKTSDGSLVKCLSFIKVRRCDILFVSKRYAIIHVPDLNPFVYYFVDVSKGEIKHVVNVWYPNYKKQFFLHRKEGEEPFAVAIDDDGKISKLRFHNFTTLSDTE